METTVQQAATERHARHMRRGAVIEAAVACLALIWGVVWPIAVVAIVPESVSAVGVALIAASVVAGAVTVLGALAGIAGCAARWRRWAR